jgi:Predicted metal-binding protein related to the C-terminal domain of SecA
MAKPGRNDPCPCGSGNKYKKCCLAKEEAVAREQLVKAQAPRDTLATRPARRRRSLAGHRVDGSSRRPPRQGRGGRCLRGRAWYRLQRRSDLVRAAKLDEAEAAARDLLRRFPDVHDGWDRLGMVHEARGDSRQAADCYRKVIAFIRDHPDDYEPGFEEVFVKLVDRLDPPTATWSRHRYGHATQRRRPHHHCNAWSARPQTALKEREQG